jgi:hypothetical protein
MPSPSALNAFDKLWRWFVGELPEISLQEVRIFEENTDEGLVESDNIAGEGSEPVQQVSFLGLYPPLTLTTVTLTHGLAMARGISFLLTLLFTSSS